MTALPLLLLLGAAQAADAPSGARLGSLKKLLEVSGRMARQWSPQARLYSVMGRAPGNSARWSPEHWEFFYGDPKTKDGVFQAVFEDGVLSARRGIREGAQSVEYFSDGKLSDRRASLTEWVTSDYADCRPLPELFAGTEELDAAVRAAAVAPDELGRFRVVLLHPRNDNCDGLGHVGELLPEKPIPKALRGKALWMVSGPEELVFFDAVTAKPLLRRLRRPQDQKKPADGPKGP